MADVFGCCASAASEARRMTCFDADSTSAGFLPIPGYPTPFINIYPPPSAPPLPYAHAATHLRVEPRVELPRGAVERRVRDTRVDRLLPRHGVRGEERDRVLRGEARVGHASEDGVGGVGRGGGEAWWGGGEGGGPPGVEGEAGAPWAVGEADCAGELDAMLGVVGVRVGSGALGTYMSPYETLWVSATSRRARTMSSRPSFAAGSAQRVM